MVENIVKRVELFCIYFVAIIAGFGPGLLIGTCFIIGYFVESLWYGNNEPLLLFYGILLDVPVFGPAIAVYDVYVRSKIAYCRTHHVHPNTVKWYIVANHMNCRSRRAYEDYTARNSTMYGG